MDYILRYNYEDNILLLYRLKKALSELCKYLDNRDRLNPILQTVLPCVVSDEDIACYVVTANQFESAMYATYGRDKVLEGLEKLERVGVSDEK